MLNRLSVSPSATPSSPPAVNRFASTNKGPALLALAKNLWRNRRLVWQFTIRNVEIRHKGSYLGLVWSFLNPLLMVGLYVLVFGFILRGRFQPLHEESRIEYALIMFLGLAIYHFTAEVLGISPTLITGNPNFVKKVVFPLEVLPVAAVGGALFHFLVTLVLVFVGAVLAKVSLTADAFWLPVILVPLLLISIGLSLLLAALGVFWRDIIQITQLFLLILMFASAVFYPISQIPSPAWAILKFNPFIHVINEAREVTFWGHSPNPLHIVYLYVFALLTLALGSTAFHRLRTSFADVL